MRKIAIALCAAVLSMSFLGCAPDVADSGSAGDDALQGEVSAQSQNDVPGSDESQGQPDEAYSGTDPKELEAAYCAIRGCHSVGELEAYSASADAVESKVSSMCQPPYCELTEEQTQALIDHYIAQSS